MALNGKKRGRKPSKRTQQSRSALQKKRHWLDCDECDTEGAWVDGDINKLICPRCTQKRCAPPDMPKKPLNDEERKLRLARKLERAKLKEAKRQGIVLDTKDLGFGRGWHRTALFVTEIDGKSRYFTFGVEITKKEYSKLLKEHTKAVTAKVSKTTGWGRGWHLKGEFVSPEGDVYESGSLTRKAKAEPDLAEFQALMVQFVTEE